MDIDILQPFVDSARDMLSSMVGLDVSEQGDGADGGPHYVSAVMIVQGEGDGPQGQVAMSFGRDSAMRHVASMLALEPDELDDEILGDGVGEMVNIVAGGARPHLAETAYAFRLGVPAIVIGDGHEIGLLKSVNKGSRVLSTELGVFTIRVWLTAARVTSSAPADQVATAGR